MTVTISKEERDALYERIVTRLNGIDGIYRAVEEEDWGGAQKLGQEFSDLLRFVCEDLGWGEGATGSFDLRAPADVLNRATVTLRRLAEGDASHFEGERREIEEQENEARNLQRVCERLLEELQADSSC